MNNPKDLITKKHFIGDTAIFKGWKEIPDLGVVEKRLSKNRKVTISIDELEVSLHITWGYKYYGPCDVDLMTKIIEINNL